MKTGWVSDGIGLRMDGGRGRGRGKREREMGTLRSIRLTN